jgi:hypothetical protein
MNSSGLRELNGSGATGILLPRHDDRIPSVACILAAKLFKKRHCVPE